MLHLWWVAIIKLATGLLICCAVPVMHTGNSSRVAAMRRSRAQEAPLYGRTRGTSPPADADVLLQMQCTASPGMVPTHACKGQCPVTESENALSVFWDWAATGSCRSPGSTCGPAVAEGGLTLACHVSGSQVTACKDSMHSLLAFAYRESIIAFVIFFILCMPGLKWCMAMLCPSL